MEQTKYRILNRDVIKFFAMFAMLLNHIANVFLESGTLLSEIFLDIGYFTAITMCYFLVEGYRYTHSKMQYGLRLFVFALISQIPFQMAFPHGGGLNMIATLFICFLILVVREKVSNPALCAILQIFLVFATAMGDWLVGGLEKNLACIRNCHGCIRCNEPVVRNFIIRTAESSFMCPWSLSRNVGVGTDHSVFI